MAGLRHRFGELPSGPWPEPPDDALLLLPLSTRRGDGGAWRYWWSVSSNPYRARNDAYATISARLAARKITAAIVNTEAFEEPRTRTCSATPMC